MPKNAKSKYNHYTDDSQRAAVRRFDDTNTIASKVSRYNFEWELLCNALY